MSSAFFLECLPFCNGVRCDKRQYNAVTSQGLYMLPVFVVKSRATRRAIQLGNDLSSRILSEEE
jgi:hypothetical protein